MSRVQEDVVEDQGDADGGAGYFAAVVEEGPQEL